MSSLIRKNKINLADYPYKQDIKNRLLLADLTVFEVDVLKEIIHNSLKISIIELAEELEVNLPQLLTALNKLKDTQLFKQERMELIVDKDLRKYYETQLDKFDEHFEPDIEFIQSLLNKIPMHVLPLWYAIPRTSDHIFSSLIEKYLLTPSIYRQYLSEIQFDEPIVQSIVEDLYKSPSFKIASSELIEKYNLTREKFEEYILLLEFHFVCCIKYEQIDDSWHEIISPFQEWLDYLLIEEKIKLKPISEIFEIELVADKTPFSFILDLETILEACQNKKLPISEIKSVIKGSESYLNHLIFKAGQVEFIQSDSTNICLTEKGISWLKKSPVEKSSILARDPLNILASLTEMEQMVLSTPRNMRLIEQTILQKIPAKSWVYIEDFIRGFIAPLSEKEGVILKNKGKKWKYIFPAYSKKELTFIESIICERFFELGIVVMGIHNGKRCFSLTPFGRVALN
jgi:hypothetical protein